MLLVAVVGAAAYGWRLLGGGLQLSALASWDTIERKLVVQAILVRRETVISAPADGLVRFAVSPGERVRPGQVIAELLDLADRRDLERQLAEVETELQADEARNRDAREQLDLAMARAEVAYQGALGSLARAVLAGEARAIGETWSAAVSAAGSRTATQNRVDEIAAIREELLARREALLQSMETTAHSVPADGQALVALSIDGLEGVTPEKVAELSAWDVLALRPGPARSAAGTRVGPGDALCKLVDPEGLTVALVVPSSAGARLQVGQRVTVRFPGTGDGVLRATVERVGPVESTGYRPVVLRTEGVLAELVSPRWVECEVLELSRSGVVIPRVALTSRDGADGVLVLSRTSAYFRPVTVLASEGGRVLVDGISPGTVVATYPWLWSILGKVRPATQ